MRERVQVVRSSPDARSEYWERMRNAYRVRRGGRSWTEEDLRAVRAFHDARHRRMAQMREAGMSNREIAEEVGMHEDAVCRALSYFLSGRRQRWR